MNEASIRPHKLRNVIQKYPWGSPTLIPDLIGADNPGGEPFAEMWMGVHERGPSKIILDSGTEVELNTVIAKQSREILGPSADERFDGELPFLFKVLAAEQPLSIQAHPNRTQAMKGFAEEEKRGIPLDDFARSYRDRNHKPEVICALTRFTAMCGFREPRVIDSLYRELDSDIYRRHVSPAESLENSTAWIRTFFRNLMELPPGMQQRLSEEAASWAEAHSDGASAASEAQLILRFRRFFGNDVGVQAPLYLNVVRLQPGEALFQPAGVLHAYVEGMGVELMANSDNVLRGGLTKKHVNVGELLKVLSFAPRPADVLHGKDAGRYVSRYDTPIDEFELLRIRTDQKDTVLRSRRSSVEMGICTAGEFTLRSSLGDAAAATLKVSRGESFLVPYAWGDYILEGSGMIYIAEIPDKKG